MTLRLGSDSRLRRHTLGVAWRSPMNRFGGGACVLALAMSWLSDADALAGRWELSVARSHYGGGAEPRIREAFACTVRGADVSCTIRSVRQGGQTLVGGFDATYGGPPGPAHGIPDVDHVTLVRINDAITDATFTSRGRPVFAYRAVRSSSGRSLTIIAVAPGTRSVLNSVVVYDRR